MVKYTSATLALFSTAKLGTGAIQPSAFVTNLARSKEKTNYPLFSSRRYTAIPYDDYSEIETEQGRLPSFPSATSLLDIVSDDNQAEVDAILAKKEERRIARLRRARKSKYQITLPIGTALLGPPPLLLSNGESNSKTGNSLSDTGIQALESLVAKGQEIALASTIGMSLRQVYSGRKLSELALDVDTLRFQSFVDELQGRSVDDAEKKDGDGASGDKQGTIQLLQNSALEMIDESFDGVVVSSVARGGLAWKSGVRAGDILTATSATIGTKLWPKSTLDGIKSAISSRKVISSTMDFEFRQITCEKEGKTEVVQTFELSLSRPIGINVEDTEDGYVTIMGISEKAASLVKERLRVGDRIISVASSVGDQMWDVYSTDGLTSAVTSRLPGQSVRLLFERVGEGEAVTEDKQSLSAPAASIDNAVAGFRQAVKSVNASVTSASSTVALLASTPSAAQKMLLTRSRDLLRTYIARNEVTKNVKVADRVLEAVMDASAILDGKTLSLVMKAYNTCNEVDKTIRIFEEVFGLAGDGSERKVEQIHGGKLRADITAFNIITISALLRAHAIRGDYESTLRVLAAVEGNTDFSISGEKSRSWSGKGDPLNMVPDTRTYNIALAAAAKRGTDEGLRAAMEIFDSMPNPSLSNPPFGKPAKNLVTFNTMINAFANAGQYHNAYRVFQTMKKSILRPDRVTYTTLIKASIKSGDINKAIDLLDDMKWVGIQPDIVSYNNIIESLCNANRLFEAKDLVNEMEKAHVSPDSMTYGLLMKGLLKANKPGPCLTLFESAFSDRRTTALTENVQLYTTAISAAAALGDHERALDLVSRMNLTGVKPNKKTLTALMGACIAGKKYKAAADIFPKIKNPDNYAISVGLQALCLAGKFSAALELITDQQSGQKMLKGKEVMSGYNALIKETLHSGEFAVAREALSGLLRAGYIPSKLTLGAISESLNLQSDMPFTSAAMKKSFDSQRSDGTFQYLLFVLDSMEMRKLTVDSSFYASILVWAAQAGGLHKRIASLFSHSRKSSNQQGKPLSEPETSEESVSLRLSWEDLFENYSRYKETLESDPHMVLPSIRVSSKDLGRVLAAEQAVAYRGVKVGSTRSK